MASLAAADGVTPGDRRSRWSCSRIHSTRPVGPTTGTPAPRTGPRITCPVILLSGASDPFVTRRCSIAPRERLPAAELVTAATGEMELVQPGPAMEKAGAVEGRGGEATLPDEPALKKEGAHSEAKLPEAEVPESKEWE